MRRKPGRVRSTRAMKLQTWAQSPRTRLDITAGLVDGILNALTLASGRLLATDAPGATADLAFRVGAASALTTIFVFFVAHYAELRAELARAERELNLLSPRQAGDLARWDAQALIEAGAGAGRGGVLRAYRVDGSAPGVRMVARTALDRPRLHARSAWRARRLDGGQLPRATGALGDSFDRWGCSADLDRDLDPHCGLTSDHARSGQAFASFA